MIVIEMNPRVSALERPGLQGDRLPDRQDRRQAGRRLHARRTAQRHHPRDAGLLRADHRLRRDQGAAVRLREVPRGRPDADDADEVRRRDDGHRPDVQGVAAEGAARPGVGPVRPRLRPRTTAGARRTSRRRDEIIAKLATPERRAHLVHPLRLQGGHDGRGRPSARRRSTRGSCTTSASSSTIEDELRAVPGRWTRSTPSCCCKAKQNGFSDRQLANLWNTSEREVRAASARRCGIEAVFKCVDTCAAEFEAYTPYYYSHLRSARSASSQRRRDTLRLGCRGRGPPARPASRGS